MLELINISLERDDHYLLAPLSYHLKSGHMLQLCGPNGSGKTTLLRILAGLEHFYDGQLLWHNHKPSDRQNNRLYLSCEMRCLSQFTVLEQLNWLASSFNYTPTEQALLDALALQKLSDKMYCYCHQLSSGQQQRLILALLAISPCPLWLLDEPFNSLDNAGKRTLTTLMQQHCQNGGAVIFSNHPSTTLNQEQKNDFNTIETLHLQPQQYYH